MKNSLGSYKIRGVLDLLRVYRSKSMVNPSDLNVSVASARTPTGNNNGFGNMQLARLKFVRTSASASNSMGNDVTPPPPRTPSRKPPSPPRGRFPMWAKLVLGSVFSMLLAFWTPNWTNLLKIGGEAEVVIKEAEQVAAVVEKVAAVVEKLSEEVAETLPDGNKFKDTALIVEHVSEEAAKDAHIAEEILHKLDVVKQDIEDVEEIVEPIIKQVEHDDKSNEGTTS